MNVPDLSAERDRYTGTAEAAFCQAASCIATNPGTDEVVRLSPCDAVVTPTSAVVDFEEPVSRLLMLRLRAVPAYVVSAGESTDGLSIEAPSEDYTVLALQSGERIGEDCDGVPVANWTDLALLMRESAEHCQYRVLDAKNGKLYGPSAVRRVARCIADYCQIVAVALGDVAADELSIGVASQQCTSLTDGRSGVRWFAGGYVPEGAVRN